MFNSTKNTIDDPYAVAFPDPAVSIVIAQADKKYQQYDSVFHVVKTSTGSVELFTDYELQCKASQIVDIIYSPATGFQFTCAA
ncbi:MAG: hypothetical protein KTR20_00975 [Cellvibrionaceae bacterium]|nr:hypothetical protein [Cellvibrionaceae bacterium]